MIITKIERQKTQPKRVNIYCDGEFVLGIHEDVLVKSRLRTGDVLDKKRLDELQSADEFHLAKEKALRFMSYRQRSEKELRTKLLEQEFLPAIIDSVVEYLTKLGFLDDRAFANAYLHDVLMKKPAGPKFIRQQLRLKGISKNIIDDVLREKLGTETEFTFAREAAAKQMHRYSASRKKYDREKQKKRLADFLARRGFAWEIVSSVLKEIFKSS